MSSSERSKSAARKLDVPVSNEPKETNSIVFEWPLRGLKQMFDSSKVDAKSKVIKSMPFGGGRWTVLFYAQSGHEQFCSLYLNAEPLPHERMHPLLATTAPASDLSVREAVHVGADGRVKGDGTLEERWQRKGLFRFTFNIQTIEDRSTLGTKEAHDHAFSHKTSNWGWAQFAKRDHVYYKNSEVVREDGFLITVTITSSPEKPKIAEPISHIVPPVLVQAMGSLLDDPEHSDVVFLLHPSRRRTKTGKVDVRKVYAIRKILAARSEYFRLMFESGFQEAEAEETSEDELQDGTLIGRVSNASRDAPAHPSRAHHLVARATATLSEYDDGTGEVEISPDDEDDDGQETFFEDSDEDCDDIAEETSGSPYSVQTPADTRQRDYLDAVNHSPNEDGPSESYTAGISDEAEEYEEDEEEDEDDAAADPIVQRSASAAADGPTDQEKGEASAETALEPVAASTATGNSSPALSTNAKRLSTRGAASSVENAPSTVRSKKDRVSAGDVTRPPSARPSTQQRTRSSTERRDRRKRRKVNVLDSAYPTFKALLFFLYTDTVEFAPLTSSFLPPNLGATEDLNSKSSSSTIGLLNPSVSANSLGNQPSRRNRDALGSIAQEMAKAHRKRKNMIAAYCERNPDKPSPCSAKAMYRLADKLDIPDLKRRAQEHIRISLTVHNIVWEVFSGFNTQYPDIRKMETDFLLKHWPQVKRSSAMKGIFLRSNAHPGLAEVWPHLLEYLEYRQPDVDEAEEAVPY